MGDFGSVSSIPRFKKEKFLKEFSEDGFRDLVIRQLFFRLGFGDGRDLCGPMEKGKDVVFTEKDKLGITNLIAVQTKKGALNMASKATASVTQAITQLRTAIDTDVFLTKTKTKQKPIRVILCASGKINEHAKIHIIDDIKDPRIQFLDSDDLIPMIDKDYPEIWLQIDADISPYFRAIKKMVEGDDSSDQSFHNIFLGAASDASYVTLKLIREHAEIKKISGKSYKIPKFEEFNVTEISKKKSRKVLIMGDAGSGKSTALLRIAYELAEEGTRSGTGYKVPILTRAVDLLERGETSLLDELDQITKELAHSKKSAFTAGDLERGMVVLLIDGLDEVPEKSDRNKIIELADNFNESYPKCQVIVTSRPYNSVRDIDSLSSYENYRLSTFSFKQAEKMLDNMRKGKKIHDASDDEIIRRIEQVHGIELNPLLITVFATTSEYNKQDIPANITELFKKFTELMLGRWDEEKGLSQQYQAPLKDFLLTRLAFLMHSKNVTKISIRDFYDTMEREASKRGHKLVEDQLIDEILNRSGLLKTSGGDVEFRHLFLQEFFAGRGIKSIDDVKTLVHTEWWKRPIVFFFGDRPSDIRGLEEVIDSIPDSQTVERFGAATTLGLATQACYLSEVEEKIHAWQWVASAYHECKSEVLKYGAS